MPLNFTLLCLFIQALVAVAAIKRTTLISPISIFCVFNFLCLFYVYLTVDAGLKPELYLSALPQYFLKPYVFTTALFYTFLSILALPLIYSVPSVSAKRFVDIAHRFAFMISAPAIRIFFAVLALLTLLHALDFDLGYMWNYRGYHAIDDPALVGLNNGLSRLAHRIGPSVAAISFCLAVVCYHTRRASYVAPAILLGLYFFAMAIASSSREISIFFALPALVHYIFKRRIDFWLVAGFVLAGLAIIFATSSRGAHADLGLGNVLSNFLAIDFRSIPVSLVGLLSNVAQGGAAFAHAVRLHPEYPEVYKFVSLISPLPSTLDNWEEVRDAYQVKISAPNPIGSLAETYYFGIPYLAAFLAAFYWCLREATLQMFNRTSFFTLPVFGFTILLIYRVHHYPTRISQRIILMLLIMYALEYFYRRFIARRRKLVRRSRRLRPGMAGFAPPAPPGGKWGGPGTGARPLPSGLSRDDKRKTLSRRPQRPRRRVKPARATGKIR